ncbi:hypothetical protein KIN20_003866 [Parelaphostrongylus tenuis]|uniref:Uncharacterized protein n=1 Tax=Parelaphostrongylus tenuis TaxID=148309 RepID=A0AAD5M279_PARTN|nr:hypothetical protein KIN20_003866 [Parelaphostrongylus tenuis]
MHEILHSIKRESARSPFSGVYDERTILRQQPRPRTRSWETFVDDEREETKGMQENDRLARVDGYWRGSTSNARSDSYHHHHGVYRVSCECEEVKKSQSFWT